MTILQLIAFVLILTYVIYIFMQTKSVKSRMERLQQEIVRAEENLGRSQENFNQIENEIFQQIDNQYVEPYSTQIKNGVVVVGMPATFLMMAWGRPHRIEKAETKNVDEVWYYETQEKLGLQTKALIYNQAVVQLKDL